MRARVVDALVVLNLLLISGRSYADDLSLQEELSKAKSAWDSLEKRANQLEAWYTVDHHFLSKGKSDTTEYHAIVKGRWRRVHALHTITDLPYKGYEEIAVLNGEKVFYVHRRPNASTYVLDRVVNRDEDKVEDLIKNQVDRYLFSPFSSLSRLVQDPKIIETKMEPEVHGDQKFIRMILKKDPRLIKPGPPFMWIQISVLLDPAHDWRIVEFLATYEKFSLLTINSYIPKSGDALLDLSRVYDAGFDKDGKKGDEVFVDFKKIIRRDISDEEFQMSAFGLPDIPLSQRGSFSRLFWLWVSLIFLALLCLLAAILLKKVSQKKTSLENQP